MRCAWLGQKGKIMANKSAKKYVGVSLTNDEFAALETLCERQHRSKSSAMKVALLDYVQKIGKRKAS